MDNEHQHPAFPQPKDPSIALWRYMDIDKFRWLVEFGRLYMSGVDRLEDPLEGTQPAGDKEWWRRNIENAVSEDKRRIIERNCELISKFARTFRDNYYVSCWHMNDSENPQMWRHYTTTPEAVAVKTTYSALKESLPHYLDIGMVRYIDYSTERLPTMNMFQYITHKEIRYRFEQEVRAVAFPPATAELGLDDFNKNLFESESLPRFNICAPQVDFSKLIQEVVLHPYASSEFEATIASMCTKAGLPKPVPSSC
jgi:hypothetical protein